MKMAAAALTLFCTCCLLQGALNMEFKVIMPKEIQTLQGSCVTIPCSFDINAKYKSNLDQTCRAKWSNSNRFFFDSKATDKTIGKLIGNLTNKDCTTTLNNIQSNGIKSCVFRLECENALIYTFPQPTVDILAKVDPPRPTLSPSTLEVTEGIAVTVKCSAPAPCLSHPPRVTWTPGLGESQETMEELEDKTKIKTSVLNFTVSRLHHREGISCTATYSKQDGSTGSSVSTRLTAVVLFPPQILPSSNCITTAAEVNCSCETVGNPFPSLSWYLDGQPVNHSDTFTVRHLEDGLRSIITVRQSPWMHRSTLVCNSSNSLGSTSHSFYLDSHERRSSKSQGQKTLRIFIITLAGLLLLLFALFIIRSRGTRCYRPKRQATGGTSSAAISHFLSSPEGNEVPTVAEENIYVNINQLRQADVPQPTRNGASGRSNEDEGESDVIYSSVKVISKQQQGNPMSLHLPNSSFTLEARTTYAEIERREGKNEAECEYAQVKFKDSHLMHS